VSLFFSGAIKSDQQRKGRTSVNFAADSQLSRIEDSAFAWARSLRLVICCGVSSLSGLAFIDWSHGLITFSSSPILFCLDRDPLTDISGRFLSRSFSVIRAITIGFTVATE
jgi:hypothetical protein